MALSTWRSSTPHAQAVCLTCDATVVGGFIAAHASRGLRDLSPGQRGLVLLLFYLLIDAEELPLVVDRPEENLDNETVESTLAVAFCRVRDRRQLILVAHNPNLTVVRDADQVFWARTAATENAIHYDSSALEQLEITAAVIRVLEGTRPSFDSRSRKYDFPQIDFL